MARKRPPFEQRHALGSQLKSVQLLRGHLLPREADWQGQECWFNSTQPRAQALTQSSRTILSDLSPASLLTPPRLEQLSPPFPWYAQQLIH